MELLTSNIWYYLINVGLSTKILRNTFVFRFAHEIVLQRLAHLLSMKSVIG